VSKIKEFFSNWRYLKFCLYVAFTALLIYIAYFFVKNIDTIAISIGHGVHAVCTALAPFLIGLILAYIFNPLVGIIDRNFISKLAPIRTKNPIKAEKKRKRHRGISAILTFLILLILIVVLIYLFAVMILDQVIFESIETMLQGISNYFSQYDNILDGLTTQFPQILDLGLDQKIQELLDKGVTWLSENFSSRAILNFLSSLGIGIANFFLGIIVAVYILIDPDFLVRGGRKFIHALFPMKFAAKLREIINDIHEVLSSFIRGQLLDALIVATISSAALSAIGLNSAVLVGCFAGIANIIPYFGPIIGMVPAFIIGLFTDGIGKAVLAVVILLVLQQIDGNIIYPKIVGKQTELNPLVVLVSILFFGHFWGVVGMIIAVPIMAIIKRLFVRFANRKQE